MDQADPIVDDFLGGNPRAEDWRSLRIVLEGKRADLRARLQQTERSDPSLARLRRAVDEIETQIDALRQEEAVSQFVEDSVRATIALPRPVDDEE